MWILTKNLDLVDFSKVQSVELENLEDCYWINFIMDSGKTVLLCKTTKYECERVMQALTIALKALPFDRLISLKV